MSTKLDNALFASDQWIRKEVRGGDEFCHRCPFDHSIQSNSLSCCPSTHTTLSPIISFENCCTLLDICFSYIVKPRKGPKEQLHLSETFTYLGVKLSYLLRVCVYVNWPLSVIMTRLWLGLVGPSSVSPLECSMPWLMVILFFKFIQDQVRVSSATCIRWPWLIVGILWCTEQRQWEWIKATASVKEWQAEQVPSKLKAKHNKSLAWRDLLTITWIKLVSASIGNASVGRQD